MVERFLAGGGGLGPWRMFGGRIGSRAGLVAGSSLMHDGDFDFAVSFFFKSELMYLFIGLPLD